MIVEYTKCAKRNRVPDSVRADATVRCGACGTEIHVLWAESPDVTPKRADKINGASRMLFFSRFRRATNALDLLVLVSIFLLFLTFLRWPYGFYVVLRMAVCTSAIYLAARAWWSRTRIWALVMMGIAVLFNPILPIYLNRSLWKALDLVVAAVLCFYFLEVRKYE